MKINSHPRLLLMGYSLHGKKTICRRLEEVYGLRYYNSSMYYAKTFMFQIMSSHGYGYNNYLECWHDRNNHQVEWFRQIKEYNKAHPARTGSQIWSQANVYSGLRDVDELRVLKARRMFDHSIWVSAFPRLLPIKKQQPEIITVGPADADHIIQNHSSLSALNDNIDRLMKRLLLK